MAVAVRSRVQVAPIGPADVGRVAGFLHENLDSHLPAATWARALNVPWDV